MRSRIVVLFCFEECLSYMLLEVEENDQLKTAFTTGIGLYQFTVMPFRLCNAPNTFQQLVERVRSDLPWEVYLLYLNDIIVHAETVMSWSQLVTKSYVIIWLMQSRTRDEKQDRCFVSF